MSLNDPLAACDRLAAIFDRALALREQGPTAVDDAVRVPVVQYAIAQLKMRVRPALEKDWLKADPVHVVLFGGTNTGKSTVLNVLLGRDGAGMSVRARFSQYPEAFRPAALGDRWLDSFPSRFAGYRRYRDEHPPHLSDEALCRDGYAPALAVIDPAHLDAEPMAAPAAPGAVLWDTPDFSTEQAWTYFRAVLDAAALADVVVMTVTDESYADDRGNALLRMLGESGVAVHVAANKLGDSATLLDDIAKTLETIGQSRAPIHRLPHVAGTKPGERLRGLLATREASAFRAAIAREAARGAELKRSGLLGAVGLLRRHLEEVLRPLVSEADVAARWASAVERITRDRLIEPYRRDYLEGIRHAEFNRALVHVMGLLQVPYIGPVLDLIGRAIRFPVRLASDTFRRLSGTPAPSETSPPEEQVVHEAIESWLAALKAEAQAMADADTHAAWSQIARRLDDDAFRLLLRTRFDEAFAARRRAIEEEVRRRAEAIYRELEDQPHRLNLLRGANLAASTLMIALVIKSGGLNWSDAVLGPALAGLWQNLLGWGLGRYLEAQRASLKQEQARSLADLVDTHLVRPVRDLYRGAASGDELAAARRDFALLSEVAAETMA